MTKVGLARRVLPLAIILPLALGWVRLQAERAGYFDTEFGVALHTLAAITVFMILVALRARELNQLDAQRRESTSRFSVRSRT